MSVPPEIECAQRSGHGERHGDHDDQRIAEALELGGKHQIDEAERQDEHDGKALACGAELAARAGNIGLHGLRQHVGRHLLHVGEGVAERGARREVAGNGHRAKLVETLQLLRGDAVGNRHQIG